MYNVIAVSTGRAHRPGAHDSTVQTARRVTVGLLVLAAVAVSVIGIALGPDVPAPDAWRTVSVDLHTTLWDLASAHPVEGLGTAATVDLIRAENALASSTLRVGQTLLVPAPDTATTALAQR